MYSSAGSLDTFSSGSFWGTGNSLFPTSNPIDDLLEKDEVTLEEILDEDTAVQETKAMNEKLIDFLKEPKTMGELLGYVACTSVEEFRKLSAEAKTALLPTISEEEDASEEARAEQQLEEAELEEDRSLKFPFAACEIICCNVTPLLEPIVSSADLLSKFFAILDQPAPLDSRLCGYFYKILSVLLQRAPEKVMWFSIYRNLDISKAGCEDGIDGIGWLMPKFLKHIDSYSVMCCFKAMLQVAADESVSENDDDDDEDNSFPGYGGSLGQQEQSGDLDGRGEGDDNLRNALLRAVRSIWLGGSGSAQAVLQALAASDNSDSHNNAAELMADMIQRAAMARLTLQSPNEKVPKAPTLESGAEGDLDLVADKDASAAGEGAASAEATEAANEDCDILPTFSGFVLVDSGKGATAETAMIESGVEWTLQLCEELLGVALFEADAQRAQAAAQSSQAGKDEAEAESMTRIVERGSAAVASLQVLTHLVSAFALERWSEPGPAMELHVGLANITTVERHGSLPPEVDCILGRLSDLGRCLKSEEHAKLFGIPESRAASCLGIHRLKIVELTCMLVHTKYPEAIRRVAACEENPLRTCLDLFFMFEWNNVLHSVVERTLQFAFLGGVSEESMGFASEGGNNSMDEDDEDDFEGELMGNFFGRTSIPGVQPLTDEDSVAKEDGLQSDGGDDDDDQTKEGEESKYARRVRLRQEEITREQRAANTVLEPLQECLLQPCELVARLLKAYEENRACVAETESFWKALDQKAATDLRGKTRSGGNKGYMGYCHRIVNTIALVAATQRNEQNSSTQGDDGSEGAQGEGGDASNPPTSLPALRATDGNEEWGKLLQGEISEVNTVEQCELGGARPRKMSGGSEALEGGALDDFDTGLILREGGLGDDLYNEGGEGHGSDSDDDDEDDEDDGEDDGGVRDKRDDDDDDEFGELAAESASASDAADPHVDDLADEFEKMATESSSATPPDAPGDAAAKGNAEGESAGASWVPDFED